MRVFLSIAYIAISLSGYAQNASMPELKLPKSVIKISPLQFFCNTLEVGIESFYPSHTKSFQITMGLRSGADDFEKGKGATLELSYRTYILPLRYHNRKGREFYQGIYGSLAINGSYFRGYDVEHSYYEPGTPNILVLMLEQIWSVGPNLTLGLHKTFWNVVFIDAYAGGGLKITHNSFERNYKPSYSLLSPAYEGIYPKGGVRIGIKL